MMMDLHEDDDEWKEEAGNEPWESDEWDQQVWSGDDDDGDDDDDDDYDEDEYSQEEDFQDAEAQDDDDVGDDENDDDENYDIVLADRRYFFEWDGAQERFKMKDDAEDDEDNPLHEVVVEMFDQEEGGRGRDEEAAAVDTLLQRLTEARSEPIEAVTPQERALVRSLLHTYFIARGADFQVMDAASDAVRELNKVAGTEEYFQDQKSQKESVVEVARNAHTTSSNLMNRLASDILKSLHDARRCAQKCRNVPTALVHVPAVRRALFHAEKNLRARMAFAARRAQGRLLALERFRNSPAARTSTSAVRKDVIEGYFNVGKAIRRALSKPFKPIKKVMDRIKNGIKKGFKKVGEGFKAIGNIFKAIGKWFAKIGKKIANFFKPFIKFFINIGLLAVGIGIFMADLFKNPFMAIFKVLMLIATIIISIALLIVYIVLTLPPIGPAYIFGYLFSVVAATAIVLLLVVFYSLLILIGLVFFLFLWIINMVTGGTLYFLLRCENEPGAWYKQPGFEVGNVYRRSLFCTMPCSGGWKRVFGGICVRKQKSCPAFCPQQQIYGYFADAATRGKYRPWIFGMYAPDMSFYTKDALEKRALLLKGLEAKKEFLGECSFGIKEYDFVTQHVCTNIDQLGVSDEVAVKLQALCKQAFCDYSYKRQRDGTVTASQRFPGRQPAADEYPHKWCSSLDAQIQSTSDQDDEALREFLVCLLMLIIGLIACFLIITVQGYMDVPIQLPDTGLA